MSKKREEIVVDVYQDERGNEFFRIVKEGSLNESADTGHLGGGYFLCSDDVDEWLDDHKDKIKVVKDYRTGD